MARAPESKGEQKQATWSPASWTGKRCAVWRLLDGEAQKAFEKWVAAEKDCYPSQVLPEHEALLASASIAA